MSSKDRFTLAEWIMDYTLKAGADEVSVNLVKAEDFELEFRENRIDKLEQGIQNVLFLEIYKDNRYSTHKSNLLQKQFLKDFIVNAVQSTIYLEQDRYRSLPDKKLYPSSSGDEMKLYDDQFSRIHSSDKIKLAAQIEKVSLQESSQIVSVTASYSEGCFHLIKLHSNGFKGEKYSTSFSIGSDVTARDDNDTLVEDSFYAHTRFFNDLPSAVQTGQEAAERCLKKVGQSKIHSGKYVMVVENSEAGTLLGMVLGAVKGNRLFLRTSYLEGRKGEKIASEKLTVIDDPFMKKGLRSYYFDSEGCAAKKRVMVEAGILQEYYIDTYYGKKLSMQANGGDRANILLDYSRTSFQDLLRKAGKGIFVTEFIGGNFNGTTGDFSFGIAGFYFEQGSIVKPVNEMNITGNALSLWNDLIDLGNDPYPYSSIQTPTLVFRDVFFSGD